MLIKSDSCNVEALFKRGNIFFHLQDYELAIEEYSKAIAIDSSLFGPLYNRGNAFLNLKQYENAISDYDRVIEFAPNFAGALINRGEVYIKLNLYDPALEDFSKAMKIDSTSIFPALRRGDVYFDLNMYNEALKDYNNVVSIDTNNVEAIYKRGCTFHNLRYYEHAIVDYTRAFEIAPNFSAPNSYLNRGHAFLNVGHFENAIEDYSKVLDFDQSLPEALLYRASAYMSSGLFEESIKDFSKLLIVDSTTYATDVYSNRGKSYIQSEQYLLAIRDLERAIELNANDATLFFNRGLAYHNLSEYQLALEDYSRSIGIDSKNDNAYLERGRVYFDLKQFDKAIADIQSAIQVVKTDEQAVDNNYLSNLLGNLAFYLAFAKQYKEMEEVSLEGLRIDSTQEWIYSNLALGLLFQGKWSQAIEIYKEYKDKPFDQERSWKEIFLNDFLELEDAGISHDSIHVIRGILNEEKKISFSRGQVGKRWEGQIYQLVGYSSDTYDFSVKLDSDGDSIQGVSQILSQKEPRLEWTYKFIGRFVGDRIIFRDIEKLNQSISDTILCLKVGQLSLFADPSGQLLLKGTWSSKNCSSGTIKLRKMREDGEL